MTNFHDIQSETIKSPDRVRCAHCGQMATREDFDYSDDWVCISYLCCTCSWWTDWEIVSDADGNIGTSSLYYLANDRETIVAWYEARHWSGFWMPDGFTVPDGALKPIEEAAEETR